MIELRFSDPSSPSQASWRPEDPGACLEWHDRSSRPLLNFTDGLHFYRMSLFSFLRKNKQESASEDSAFYSRAEEDSKAVRNRSSRRRSGQNSKDDSVDPVLPEKKRARRRLIGAVALVLAAVIGLPMILDSEPKPLADDIAIQIPSKDKIAPADRGEPSSAKVGASASLDPKEEVVESAPTSVATADSKPSPPAQTSHSQNDSKAKDETGHPVRAPAAPAEAPPQAAKTEPKHDTRTEAKQAERTDDGARATALLEGKADPKAEEKKSGKFVIQIAALASKEKVDELQSKLKGAGIKSYTQKVATESGERTRIRVGPFASKDEAEKVRAKIVKLGLNGTLVPA
ncbi:MAG TPA: SPOR domain-containing protein [Noviherbaspirillum sp.]